MEGRQHLVVINEPIDLFRPTVRDQEELRAVPSDARREFPADVIVPLDRQSHVELAAVGRTIDRASEIAATDVHADARPPGGESRVDLSNVRSCMARSNQLVPYEPRCGPNR